MESRLVLGSAQFGLDYGISNQSGKVRAEEVASILNIAHAHQVDMIDTAVSYGESELVLGENFENLGLKFEVISKLPGKIRSTEVSSCVQRSLQRLRTNRLYGFLIHDFEQFKRNKEIYTELTYLKMNGFVKKIGFSLYHPHELEYLVSNEINFDLLQVPYNIFDQRFEPYLQDLNLKGVEVHTRSVFLQGLFFIKIESLPVYFYPIRSRLSEIQNLSSHYSIPLEGLLLNFALGNEFIDRVIIGVVSKTNILNNLEAIGYRDEVVPLLSDLKGFALQDEKWLLPYKWSQ